MKDHHGERAETLLLYLEEPQTMVANATIVSAELIDANAFDLVLDRTPFYPQGGGQPSDSGELSIPGGVARVDDVRQTQGRVVHHCIGDISQWRPGNLVLASVNAQRREENSRLHTAGELLCAAVRDLGHDWPVVAAMHFPARAFVEFGGAPYDTRSFAAVVESKVASMVVAGGKPKITTVAGPREAEALCGFSPTYLPEGTPVRIVNVWGKLGRPCMGTHVESLADVGAFSVRKVKISKGRTMISYVLDECLGFRS